eukprot:8042562-Pyramimonas_sp.AAC.1
MARGLLLPRGALSVATSPTWAIACPARPRHLPLPARRRVRRHAEAARLSGSRDSFVRGQI